MFFLKRAWVEIDLTALKNNYKSICEMCGTKVIPVVKADAYGHGVEQVVKALQNLGADMFAVSNVLEAVELRNAGIKGDILVLGFTSVDAVELLLKHNITQSIYSLEYAVSLSEKADEMGDKIKSHLKLDTGMGRIGFNCRENDCDIEDIKTALNLNGLIFTGAFMHFAVADSEDISDIEFTKQQFSMFENILKKLKDNGFDFKMKHCCNSAGALMYKSMSLDAVRAGIILYGLAPSEYVTNKGLTPVMSLYSVVSHIKEINPNDTVSYGRTYKADEKRKIATVTAGYADGVPRLLSNKGYVLINGKKAPIVGRVCMDQFCIDITDIPDVKIGDICEIFGKNLSVDVVANNAQTINYEIVCGISKRVQRVYI